MKKLILGVTILCLILFSCVSEKQELQNNILLKEKTFNEKATKGQSNKKDIHTLISLYEKFFKTFPTDTISANYLMKAGEMAMFIGLQKKAIEYYDAIENSFSKTSHYPMSIFMKAFIYDEINDTAKARIYYNQFLTNFPTHKLAKDARISKQNLGKSIEEIVSGFSTPNSNADKNKEKNE